MQPALLRKMWCDRLNRINFRQSHLEDVHAVFSAVHTKSDTNSGGEKEKRLLSHLRAAGQSQNEVGVNVGLSVSESYRSGRTQTPLIWRLKVVRGGGLWGYLTIQQAVLMEYTGPYNAHTISVCKRFGLQTNNVAILNSITLPFMFISPTFVPFSLFPHT